MKYNAYPSSNEYSDIIWKQVNFLWDNPDLFEALSRKLNPILVKLLSVNPNLDVIANEKIDRLERAHQQSSIIKAIWLLIEWGETVYDELKVDHPYATHIARKQTFNKIKQLIEGFAPEFVDLVLSFWMLKEQRGNKAFMDYFISLGEHWDKFYEIYPEFFKGPGPLVSHRQLSDRDTKPSKPSRSLGGIQESPRRRESMKKEGVEVS